MQGLERSLRWIFFFGVDRRSFGVRAGGASERSLAQSSPNKARISEWLLVRWFFSGFPSHPITVSASFVLQIGPHVALSGVPEVDASHNIVIHLLLLRTTEIVRRAESKEYWIHSGPRAVSNWPMDSSKC